MWEQPMLKSKLKPEIVPFQPVGFIPICIGGNACHYSAGRKVETGISGEKTIPVEGNRTISL